MKKTQKEVGNMMGVRQGDLSRVINGKRNFGDENAEMIAAITGSDPWIWSSASQARKRLKIWFNFKNESK